MPTILVLVLIFIILLILVSCIRIVPQAQAMVVERLGAYLETWNVGIHFKVPFIDRVAKRVLLKEQVVDFAPQPVITKDNVTMKIDTVVFFQITDPKLYACGVDNPIMAIENLTATTLRNIIGDMELDQSLTSRDTINSRMRSILDEATDPWGIKVNRVSAGTADQIYFSVRMAVSQMLYDEPMPLILDDSFVLYDDERLKNTLRWLTEQKAFSQILIFTCHHREAEMLESLNCDYHYVEL